VTALRGVDTAEVRVLSESELILHSPMAGSPGARRRRLRGQLASGGG
jgi:hypothetical protein